MPVAGPITVKMIFFGGHFVVKRFGISIIMTYFVVIISAQLPVPPNLPQKVFLPENAETGHIVYTVKEIIDSENPRNTLDLYEFYPSVTRDVFQYNNKSKEISVGNSGLLNFESLHKSYLILFQEKLNPSKVYPLMIELVDVPEATDFKLEKTTADGCCDDVRRLFWVVPISSALEFILITLLIIFLLCCVVQKGKQKIVKPVEK